MIFSHVDKILSAAEKDATICTREQALVPLRALSVDDFGNFLFSLPNPQYPKLSALLPSMVSEDAQLQWTGNTGIELLRQSCAFTRSLSYKYLVHTGKALENANILDFGCGYGRLLRMMYYYTQEENIYGVDPMDMSISICRDNNVLQNVKKSSYVPSSLPFEDKKFDLIYAYSVFTHLSKLTTIVSLKTLSLYMHDDSLVAFTIRPVEFWNDLINAYRGVDVSAMLTEHDKNGFAFMPLLNHETYEGETTFGDTSMTITWLRDNIPELRIIDTDCSLEFPYQITIFAKKNI